MIHSQVRGYEKSIESLWDTFQGELEDDFSLSAVVNAASRHGFSISGTDWSEYFDNLILPKSKIKLYGAMNDNGIQELSCGELDYVVGGVAALPVAAVVIAVATYAVVGVSVAVGAAIVVFAGASIGAWVTVFAWVSS